MPTISTSVNIGAVTYASGEAFSFSNSVSVPTPRLTIDAQVPADVAKVESVLPGNIAIGTSGELYVVNTSTTTPLIIKLLDQNRDITAGGRLGRFVVRGAYISIGTGTGADGQSVSSVVGGKSIDWPPFVEVETAAGSGVYVSMLNIHGNYQNDAAALPTVRQVFASVGTTPELGCFFEYDEINRSIKFGGAGGGWVPPAGANIRIPNIHFTAGGVPAAAPSSRSLFPTSGFVDLENCSFSNRFAGGFGSQSSLRLVNVGLPAAGNAQSIRERLYWRNVCIAAEVYATGIDNRWNGISDTDIDGYRACVTGNARITLSKPAGSSIKNVSAFQFSRGVASVYPLAVIGDASDETRKRMENILVAGGGAQLSGLNNLVINGFYPSDTINNTKITTLAQPALQLANNVINSTVQRVRIPNGGTPSYTRWLNVASTSVRGCAVHDVVYDGDNHTDYHILSAAASRLWLANQQLDNPRTGTFADGAPNSVGFVPLRASAISGATTKAIVGMPGAQMSMVKSGTTALIANSNGQPDMELLHTSYTGATGGVLTVLLGSLNINSGRYEVLAGVEGVDYRFRDSEYSSLSAASDIVFTSKAPARGITSFTGCALSGAVPTANTSFRMRAAGQGAPWPSTWTVWSAANLTTEFNALAGYDSSVGFDMQVRVVGTGASIASTTSIGVTGLTVDTAFAPYDVGFVEIAVLGGQSGAVVGIVDTFAANVLFSFDTLGASGAKVIDYPYNYDNGIARPYRLVSRKVGYLESVTVSAVDQTGATVPVPLVAAHPCVSSSVVGVTVNGAAKTIAVAGGLDFLDVYQHAQWWATQRENIVFDTPMTSTDGQVFEVPLSFKVQWPSMGTDGTLAGGWLQLAAPGTHTYKLSGTKIEFQAAGSYNMSGTQFGGTVELINTSGGAVTVSVPSGTSYTNTGPGITVTAPTVTQGLSFTGLLAGSEVFVFASGTQTVLASTTNSGATFNWSQTWAADVTVDYTVFKDGYIPIRVTGIVIGQSVATAPVGQVADRSYSPSSGLTFGSNATANVGTSRFGLTVPSTVQNWYSFMVESWRTQATLKNKAFPLSSNGPNSFALEGWEFSAGLNLLYRDGLRYTVAGVATAIYAAVYSVDTAAGMQVRFQQVDGSATASAATTGKIDQLIQVYGDAIHGSFDRRGFLALKIQRDGYDQAETDVVATYGALDDQLYVVGLNPLPNGLPTGAPTINGAPSIVDHGASPVTWNSKQFSITVTDSAAGNTGQALMRWIRYNLGLGGTFQGKEAFNWHDLVQTSGTGFKTVRGMLYGDSGAALKGVRVVTSAGEPHPDFNLHTADDGSTFVPVFPAMATATVLANTRVQLFNITTAAELDNQLVAGTTYSFVVSAGVSVGDTLRLRVCKMGYQSGEAIGLWTATGLTFLVSQPVDAIYNTWGIDGSTVTEFAGDVTGHVYIDANDLDGETTKTRLGAWYSWVLTTSLGISHFYGGVTFLSPAEIRINVDVANILVENVNASTALRFTDTDVRLFRSDGSSIIAPSSYSIHNDYSGVPDYSVISVGGANVITGDVADVLAAIPSAGTNASAVRTNLATELARIDVAVSSVSAGSAPSAATVAAAVRAELGTELARLDVAVGTRNAATPPTATEIVTAVEGSAVLAKEATVASRLAASSYQAAPSAAQVAAEVLAAAAAAPIAANIEKINGTDVTGAGVAGNEWGPA